MRLIMARVVYGIIYSRYYTAELYLELYLVYFQVICLARATWYDSLNLIKCANQYSTLAHHHHQWWAGPLGDGVKFLLGPSRTPGILPSTGEESELTMARVVYVPHHRQTYMQDAVHDRTVHSQHSHTHIHTHTAVECGESHQLC